MTGTDKDRNKDGDKDAEKDGDKDGDRGAGDERITDNFEKPSGNKSVLVFTRFLNQEHRN
jgi:hypothetical protein